MHIIPPLTISAGAHFPTHKGMDGWVNPQPGWVGSGYWTWDLLHESLLLYQLSYLGKMFPSTRRKVKDWWKEEPYKVECQVAEGIPSYLMRNQQTGHSWVLHQNWLFLITPTEGTPLCMIVHAKWARCTTTTLEKQILEKSETEEAPQSANCLSPTQHQTGETPLGWLNRKLHAFICIFPRASLLDKGWKVWCRGIGGVQMSTSAFWRWRYWSHQWG